VIGLVIWHAKWIPRIGEVMLPLIECRKRAKSGAKFPWTKECDEALAKIKKAIAQATLRSRTGPGVYHIYTDAAEFCVSWHVVREDRGQQHLMEFGSHVLTDAEIRYSMPKKELFAIALAAKKSRWMCLGREVVIHTDQIAWATELDLKSPTGVLARWLEWANELNPKTVFICGEENVVADCLSRLTPVKGSASAEDVVCAIETTKERAKAIEEQMKRGPVFVPVEWRKECLRTVHDGFLGAHLGATKMSECLRERYTWPGMSEDVKAYKCEFCEQHKPDARDVRNPMTAVEAVRPWDVVGIDLVPVTAKNGEQLYFFLGVDYFTKKVVTMRMKATTAADVINAICFEVIFPFATPRVLVSDRGTQLVGNEMTEWCAKRGIVHMPATEYHQQANGQCERLVRVLRPIILAKIVEYKLKFKAALAVATAAVNKFLVSSTTGVAPDHALFGVPPVSDFDLRLMRHLESVAKTQKSVAEKSSVAKERQKARYDVGKVEKHYKFGELVRLRNRAKGGVELFTGPAEVVKVLDRDNYVVYDYQRSKSVVVNVSNMREFNNSTSLPDAADVPIRKSVGDKFEPSSGDASAGVVFSPTRTNDLPSSTSMELRSRRIEMLRTPSKLAAKRAIERRESDARKPIVGARIKVFWEAPLGDNKWYEGTIVGESRVVDGVLVDGGTHDIDYDDIIAKEPNTPVAERAVSENLTGDGERAIFELI
jgi:transposase InsO family protein